MKIETHLLITMEPLKSIGHNDVTLMVSLKKESDNSLVAEGKIFVVPNSDFIELDSAFEDILDEVGLDEDLILDALKNRDSSIHIVIKNDDREISIIKIIDSDEDSWFLMIKTNMYEEEIRSAVFNEEYDEENMDFSQKIETRAKELGLYFEEIDYDETYSI